MYLVNRTIQEIQKFSTNGDFLTEFGGQEVENEDLYIVDVSVDWDYNVYVISHDNNIYKFAPKYKVGIVVIKGAKLEIAV